MSFTPRLQTHLIPLTLAALLLASPLSSAADTGASNEFLEDARDRLENGDPRAAVVQLKNALQSDSENVQARLLLGELYLAAGDLDSAEKELRRAHSLSPSDVTELLLGRTLLAMQLPDEVLAMVSETAADPEQQRSKRLLRVDALIAAGRTDEVDLAIQRLHGDYPLDVDVAMLDARASIAANDPAGALDKAALAVSLAPDNAAARLLHGTLALQTGASKVAEAELRALENLAPGTVPVVLLQAELNLQNNAFAEAEAATDAVLKREPANVRAQYLKARALFGLERYQDADRLMRQLSEYSRFLPEAMLLNGMIKIQTGQHAQAAQSLADFLRNEPDNVAARRMLGGLYIDMDQPLSAVDVLSRGLAPDSNDVETLNALATAQLYSKDYRGAVAILRQVAAISDGTQAAQAGGLLNLLGDGNDVSAADHELILVLDGLRRGQLNDALDRAEAQVEAEPENADALGLLGAVHMARNEDDAARSALEGTLALDPTNASARSNLNRLDLRAGNLEAVRARLEADLAADPTDVGVRTALANALLQANETEAAIEILQDDETTDGLLAQLQLFERLQRPDDVLATVEALAADEQDRGRFEAARGYIRLGRPADTLRVMESLPQDLVDQAIPRLLKARAQYELGDNSAALETLEPLQARVQTNLFINGSLVDLKLTTGDIAGARATVDKLREIDPEQATLLDARIANSLEGADAARAVLEAQASANSSPDLARALFRARLASGDRELAVEGLRSYVRERPADAAAVELLSMLLLQDGDMTNARLELERAFRLTPNNAKVLNNLAWVRHEQGAQGALELAARAYALAPDSGEIADTFGWILVNEGKVEDGLRLLREADGALERANPDVRYHLAFALNASGRNGEAKHLLEQLLEEDETFARRRAAEKLLSELSGS